MTFTNAQKQTAEWQFPASGSCYFAKNHKGQVKVYQHVKDDSPEAPRLVIAHSTKRLNNNNCEGQSVGILAKDGEVFISLPPYMTYSMCLGPKGGVDEKNYSSYWFEIQKEGASFKPSFQ